MAPLTARVGQAEVTWLDGALLVALPHGAVLVDAPPGVERALADTGRLGTVTGVVVTNDRWRAVGGLLGVCAAITEARGRRPGLHLVHPLSCERVVTVADAWSRGWPAGVRLDVDGVVPGEPVQLPDGVEATLVPLALAEAAGGSVVPVAGCGVRLDVGGHTIAWAPAARPGTSLARLAAAADLAVVECGRRPGPETEPPWRPGLADASAAAIGARAFWVVGDDGRVVATGEEN